MSTYSEAVIKLNVGDLVVVFSDGITEAMNESEEEYGDERLEKLLQSKRHLSCKEITEAVFKSVKEHMQKEVQFDDMTMLLFKKIS